MTIQPKSRQRGISFLGLVFVGGVLAITGVVAAQVFPTFVEYQAIDKAAQKASEGNTVAEVRTIFDRAAEIDDITSISAKDLEVTKEDDKIVVKYRLPARNPPGGPGVPDAQVRRTIQVK